MQVFGIDLSMEKFDANFLDLDGTPCNKQVKNRVLSISKFLSKVPAGAIFCAEHTGVYSDLLVYLCNQFKIPIALVPGYTLKHSLGILKGKSDPIDAQRIRDYGERFFDKLIFKEYDSEQIVELKSLYALRSQLVRTRKVLRTGDSGRQYQPMQSLSVKKHLDKALSELDKQIKAVEQEIELIISMDVELNENYRLAISVNGVGPIIATDMLIKTGNFKDIDTARKASSYAGVCPFPNSSGKMVGKTKTSPFSDKKLKALLYMGAKAALKHNRDYQLYYEKKKLEGKHHYLIMNNLSNKILRTIFSVVKNKLPYDKYHICKDPREKINSFDKKVA